MVDLLTGRLFLWRAIMFYLYLFLDTRRPRDITRRFSLFTPFEISFQRIWDESPLPLNQYSLFGTHKM